MPKINSTIVFLGLLLTVPAWRYGWSLFLIMLQVFSKFIKRDSSIGVFLFSTYVFLRTLFYIEHLRRLLLKKINSCKALTIFAEKCFRYMSDRVLNTPVGLTEESQTKPAAWIILWGKSWKYEVIKFMF